MRFMPNITLQQQIFETGSAHHVKTSFSQISRKIKVLEHMFVHNININVVFPHLLSPKSTLCDLQEPRYKISRPKKWAWPFQGLPPYIILGSLHFFIYWTLNEQKNIGSNVHHYLQPFCHNWPDYKPTRSHHIRQGEVVMTGAGRAASGRGQWLLPK